MKSLVILLKNANSFIKRIEEEICSIIVVMLVVSTAIGVFWRYVLHNPLPWPNELGMFLLLWLAFLGASLANKDDGHYKISILYNALPEKVQRVTNILNDLLKLTFLIIFIYISIRVFPRQAIRRMTVYLGINKAWHTFSLTVGFSFMVLFVFKELLLKLSAIKKRNNNNL